MAGIGETLGLGLVAIVAFVGGSFVAAVAVAAFDAIALSVGLGSLGPTLTMLFGLLGGVFTAGWVIAEVND